MLRMGRIAMGAGLVAATAAGFAVLAPGLIEPAFAQNSSKPITVSPPAGAPMSFADLIDKVSPAVVSVQVTTEVKASARNGVFDQFRGLPGFEEYEDRFGEGEGEDENPAQNEEGSALGSGFFITSAGYIVTNHHVVENAREVTVTLKDGTQLEAELVGSDEQTDLAVLKVKKSGSYPFVQFVTKSKPRVGDWVVAVGNPFGLGGTATAGIVSAISRQDPSGQSRGLVDFLQIDAAINRGNSGGPTFDIYGRVIGVNSAIISPTGGSVGIGFAIPASTAKPIVDKLMRGETVERGYLGVSMGTLQDRERAALGLADTVKGAFVADVTAGGPADKAGIRPEDVIVSVNGRDTETGEALTRIVAGTAVGETLRIELYRGGRRQTVTARAERRPPQSELDALQNGSPGGDSTAPQAGAETIEGMTVQSLTPALRQRLRLSNDQRGVAITAVAPRSKAAQLGFSEGVIILNAFGRPVNSPAELKSAIDAARAAGRPGVMLRVQSPRGGSPVSVALELSAD